MKIFLAHLDRLYEMLRYIKSEACSAGITEPALSKIELASEELLVNIISHAYPDREDGEIEIRCIVREKESVEIIVKDQGIAFNPVENAKQFAPKSSPPGGNKSVGGYGIYFIIKMMDDVHYQRAANTNIVTMKKKVTSAVSP